MRIDSSIGVLNLTKAFGIAISVGYSGFLIDPVSRLGIPSLLIGSRSLRVSLRDGLGGGLGVGVRVGVRNSGVKVSLEAILG
jgi:hypothetical protein